MRLICKMLKIIGVIILIIAIIIILILLGVTFWPAIGRVPDAAMRAEYVERTVYFDGKTFKNIDANAKQLVDAAEDKGTRLTPTDEIPVKKSESIEQGEEGKLYVYWLGHSSSLVQLGEKNILIDPVFNEHASPVWFAGPKRFSDVPIETENLPKIDVLLISHDHYDHLDYATIKAIDDRVEHYIVPLGVESYLEGWGVDPAKISNIAWYENVTIDGVEYTATPSQHYTMRNPLHQNATWWCGYYFKDEYHSVYYTGDGGYSENFNQIAQKVGPIDLALIECGQYGKGWPYIHMFPEESIQAIEVLNPKWTIPVHWGAYCICYNDWDDSIIRFTDLADEKNIKYATPLIGEKVDFDTISEYSKQWWAGLN